MSLNPSSKAELQNSVHVDTAFPPPKIEIPDNIDPRIRMENKPAASPNLKYVSLVLLTVQNALLILVMRYTRIRVKSEDLYLPTTAVVLSELLKLIISLSIIFVQESGWNVARFIQHLHENIVQQPLDCFKVTIPAIIYTLQNNLLYVAVSNLEAATYQVSYQLKILTTALFSVFMLQRQLSKLQWVALAVLFVGVAAVQVQPHGTKDPDSKSNDQNPLLGLLAVIVACFMSGFAGVYFEKILKGTKQSVWLRNVQLSVFGVIVGLLTVFINDGAAVSEHGFFKGYDWVVWAVIVIQSCGGLIVAVVVKYADNILKGFATSAAIVVSCVASIYFFDFQLSIPFSIGTVLVIISVYMYSKFVPVVPSPLPK